MLVNGGSDLEALKVRAERFSVPSSAGGNPRSGIRLVFGDPEEPQLDRSAARVAANKRAANVRLKGGMVVVYDRILLRFVGNLKFGNGTVWLASSGRRRIRPLER